MNFVPIHDWRNYRTATREARTQGGARVTVAQDTTDAAVYIGLGWPRPTELQLTPREALALGTELMQAAMAMATTTETTR